MIAQSFRITNCPQNYYYGYYAGGSSVIVFISFPKETYEGPISKLKFLTTKLLNLDKKEMHELITKSKPSKAKVSITLIYQ